MTHAAAAMRINIVLSRIAAKAVTTRRQNQCCTLGYLVPIAMNSACAVFDTYWCTVASAHSLCSGNIRALQTIGRDLRVGQ